MSTGRRCLGREIKHTVQPDKEISHRLSIDARPRFRSTTLKINQIGLVRLFRNFAKTTLASIEGCSKLISGKGRLLLTEAGMLHKPTG